MDAHQYLCWASVKGPRFREEWFVEERSIGPGTEEPATVDDEDVAEAAGAGCLGVAGVVRGWCDWARRRALLLSFMQILINSSKSSGREIW